MQKRKTIYIHKQIDYQMHATKAGLAPLGSGKERAFYCFQYKVSRLFVSILWLIIAIAFFFLNLVESTHRLKKEDNVKPF